MCKETISFLLEEYKKTENTLNIDISLQRNNSKNLSCKNDYYAGHGGAHP